MDRGPTDPNVDGDRLGPTDLNVDPDRDRVGRHPIAPKANPSCKRGPRLYSVSTDGTLGRPWLRKPWPAFSTRSKPEFPSAPTGNQCPKSWASDKQDQSRARGRAQYK